MLDRIDQRWLVATGLVLVAAAIWFFVHDRSPQISGENRFLIEALQTAVSSRQENWLDTCARKVAERHESGAMTDAEFAAFESIIAQARAGDWEPALREVFALGEAQRPTAEDLQRVESRMVLRHEH